MIWFTRHIIEEFNLCFLAMFRNQLPYFTDELMLGQAISLIYELVNGLIESKVV